jgi:hypothetical protein
MKYRVSVVLFNLLYVAASEIMQHALQLTETETFNR